MSADAAATNASRRALRIAGKMEKRFYFEGYSVAETAKILRLSENAVKKRLQRAREALKIALSEPEENRKAQNRKSMKTLNQTEFYHREEIL